ncbi:hypothetical protein DSM112329_00149 [Paraconexibacter sp. AEG42_29]|uniref:Uncharacterized protein n=1 Tax=Paraconexibacter sp. AEG42_29 TaxID=2997339 RepID=A0AAU7AP41_9ACTN
MRSARVLTLAGAAAAAVAVAGSAAAVTPVTPDPVAPALTSTLKQLKAKTKLPVLLPSELPVFREGKKPLYPTIGADAKSYAVTLGLVPDCGANVCSVGYLYALRTKKFPSAAQGKYKVKLRKGATGRYQPLSCGASCTPPTITFRSAGVNYSYSLKLDIKRPDTDRSVLTKLANQALAAGPR